MTGMEHATEKAARVIQQARDAGPVYDDAGEPLPAAETIARALADAGLLAPAPLREEWAAIDDDGTALMRYGADSHSPHREYGTSRTYSRWASDWKRYDDQ